MSCASWCPSCFAQAAANACGMARTAASSAGLCARRLSTCKANTPKRTPASIVCNSCCFISFLLRVQPTVIELIQPAHAQILQIQILIQALARTLAAKARLLDAPKRRNLGRDDALIDSH